VLWTSNRLPYDPSSIKRARITIIGEKIINQNQRHAKAPIRVNVSPVFDKLEYRVKSSPPLVAEHLPDTASRIGSIEFSNMETGRFYVDWNQASPGQLQCSISAGLQPGDRGVIQEQTAPTVNLEFESRDACVTTPLQTLCKSKHILLRSDGAAGLMVWISISSEMFIGRSRFELSVHAGLIDPPSARLIHDMAPSAHRTRTRRMKQELIPWLIGVDDESLRLPHRQRNPLPSTDEEE
jgi:hypothetical protein